MAKTYEDIQRQISALQKTADALRQREVAAVIDRIRRAIVTYGITAADLGLAPAKPAAAAKRAKPAGAKRKKGGAAVRYRDDSGHTWSGRGRRPGWFTAALAAGKSAEDLRAPA